MPLDLGYVYTDRARVYAKTPGPRVMGERPMYEAVSGWVACRVSPPTGTENRQTGRHRVDYTHSLICGFTDVDGFTFTIREQDRVEVQGSIPFTPSGMFDVVSVMVPRDLTQNLLIVVQLMQVKEY